MAALPSSLALTAIADASPAVAADVRNNYSAIQTATNALITALSGGAAGDVLGGNGTTVTYAKPPGYRFAYTEYGLVSTSTATEAAPLDVVSAGAVTFDGATTVDIEFYCPWFNSSGAASAGFSLWDGTDLGRLYFSNGTQIASPVGGKFGRTLTPSAGAHTYKVRLWTAGAVTIQLTGGAGGPGVSMPGYIKITKAV